MLARRRQLSTLHGIFPAPVNLGRQRCALLPEMREASLPAVGFRAIHVDKSIYMELPSARSSISGYFAPSLGYCVLCQSNLFQRGCWGGASPPRWGGRSTGRSTGRWGTRSTGRSSARWGGRSTPRSTPLSSEPWGAHSTGRSSGHSSPRSTGRSTPRWGGRSTGRSTGVLGFASHPAGFSRCAGQ
jgi:hypothetical protein